MIGLRELVLIALVFLTLYGRSGVLKSDRAQAVMPWLSPVRRKGAGRPSPRPVAKSRVAGAFLTRNGRLFWFLTILAATAVAAWVATRTLIASGTTP